MTQNTPLTAIRQITTLSSRFTLPENCMGSVTCSPGGTHMSIIAVWVGVRGYSRAVCRSAAPRTFKPSLPTFTNDTTTPVVASLRAIIYGMTMTPSEKTYPFASVNSPSTPIETVSPWMNPVPAASFASSCSILMISWTSSSNAASSAADLLTICADPDSAPSCSPAPGGSRMSYADSAAYPAAAASATAAAARYAFFMRPPRALNHAKNGAWKFQAAQTRELSRRQSSACPPAGPYKRRGRYAGCCLGRVHAPHRPGAQRPGVHASWNPAMHAPGNGTALAPQGPVPADGPCGNTGNMGRAGVTRRCSDRTAGVTGGLQPSPGLSCNMEAKIPPPRMEALRERCRGRNLSRKLGFN
ncbi:hypothetical protein CENSYa_1035 [Cenarchaeum symbiosum A]|uniref:Uncharacterized protein n=1 Tax=Cenarchaeum symbiosum (strain A) TaxID=414004 RepID=A0RWE9_CENSY|nr:hypothetical protein CENSYa_1035 [Cenarchaeum symbiosum A]